VVKISKKILFGLFVTFILMSLSVFAQQKVTYSGKDYYVVKSSYPSEDSGDEVCAKVGMSCVGYTEPSNGVCKLAHAGAASSSSSGGDLSGVYCNGAPQTGVCSAKSDTCHTCPACSVSVQCDEEIGGLYDEMYVECTPSGGSCPVFLAARNVQQLLNEIPALNSALQGCATNLPGGLARVISGDVVLSINMNSGAVESLTFKISNGKVNGVSKGAGTCKHKAVISENDMNAILSSRNRATAILSAFGSKKITLGGCTIIRSIISFIGTPIARFVVNRNLPPPPAPIPVLNCGNLGEQCNNRGCTSGICAAPYEDVNGQSRPVNYRCIDQNGYNSYCVASGNSRAPWDCITYPCR
jgi:hypothetical protein